jgi:hypothetical protein
VVSDHVFVAGGAWLTGAPPFRVPWASGAAAAATGVPPDYAAGDNR